jgi:hypothetical protein
MINLVRSGALEAVWWVDPQTEQARAVFLSEDVTVHDPDAYLKSLVEEEGEMAPALLMAMIVFSDSRLCPSGDEHRAQYRYNTAWKFVQCDACAITRKERYQANRAKIEPVAATFLDLPTTCTSR